MSDPIEANLPAWVQKRGGRLEAFDADKICRSLFAATEACGRPNAFLSRELTDGVLHFLARDLDGKTPTSGQVGEIVGKIVRELGQPVVAIAYAEFGKSRGRTARKAAQLARSDSPVGDGESGFSARQMHSWFRSGMKPMQAIQKAGRAALREWSLNEVFSRDVVAAMNEGLVSLGGLDAPMQLGGAVLGGPLPVESGVIEAIDRAHRFAGNCIAIDGPEHEPVVTQDSEPGLRYVRELRWSLRGTGLTAVVNLNSTEPPAWAATLAGGPLFPAAAGERAGRATATSAAALARKLLEPHSEEALIRLDWHLGADDFSNTQLAADVPMDRGFSGRMAYVFDRPGRPVALAEGLDRDHPAYLLDVGIHLPRLADQPSARRDAGLFIRKLRSLTRVALTAAARKRDYLRKHSSSVAAQGQLLDRSRVVIVPIGLQDIVQVLTDREIGEGEPALGQELIACMHEVAEHDGHQRGFEICLDSSPRMIDWDSEDIASPSNVVSGLTTWRPGVAGAEQIRGAGWLHERSKAGTLAVVLEEDASPTVEELNQWLRLAWEETSIVRIVFTRVRPPASQMVAPWEKS